MNLDETDRRLIAALRDDGRASISTLAATLDLARGTVRTRLDRLVETGVIRRFTIDLAIAHEPKAVRAVMTISLQGRMSRSVVSALTKMPEMTALHTTNGAWDLVAEIRVAALPDLDRVLREVRSVQGVANSETSILLDTIRG
ncbi:MAG: Lrp/AsnC family transcriptional regulator [Pseudomonadota bacterium]